MGPGADAYRLVCEAGHKARVSLRWVGRAQGALGMVSAHWWQSWILGFLLGLHGSAWGFLQLWSMDRLYSMWTQQLWHTALVMVKGSSLQSDFRHIFCNDYNRILPTV